MATYLIDYENVYIEGLTGLEYLNKAGRGSDFLHTEPLRADV